jgi:hypothetical protein
MAENEGARKSGKFLAVCLTPDVCKTPVGNTVVPVPYQITANLSDSMSTSPNVRFGGDQAFILDKSTISKVTGDEAGTAGGVKSGVNRAYVKPIKGSNTVRVNKKYVIRHGDTCEMNSGNTTGRIIFQGMSKTAAKISIPPVESETPARYSLAFDFSEMEPSGIFDDVKRSFMSVELTTPGGKYLSTLLTDATCVTDLYFSDKEEDVVAWAGSGRWEVAEGYELILDETIDNHEDFLDDDPDDYGEDKNA